VRPRAGRVTFDGADITGRPTQDIIARGIGSVPEARRLFGQMTVRENLRMGAYLRRDRAVIGEDFDRVLSLFPRVAQRLNQRAGTLSGGEQQMVAIARALMSQPRLLMLDEPSLGLAPLVVKEVFDVVATIREAGTTVLLVEQNVHRALEIADRGYVLETGRIVLEGSSADLLANPEVRTAYLGF
jgi:branched-chain amino acid transport system ATP-binding protein